MNQFTAHALLTAMCALWRHRPVPLGLVLGVRRLLRAPDALFPAYDWVITSGRVLNDDHLASALAHKELGAWSLAGTTINFLDDYVRQVKPRRVLEFGAGLSTACLAHFLYETIGEEARVIAIDQSSEFLSEARNLINDLGLSHIVDFHVRALRSQTLDGESVQTYDLDEDFLTAIIGPVQPDLVLVDGPSSGVMGRFAVLRLLQSQLRVGTTVMLDDALRDEELTVARRWRDDRVLALDGIYLFGKGLLVGRIV